MANSNVTIATPQPSSATTTVLTEPFPDPALIGSLTEVVAKTYPPSSDPKTFLEIRPANLRRLPDEIPIYVEMVDANMKTCSIELADGTIVQALRLAPNPDNFIINSGKIINRYNTMTRWVEEHWGDDMDSVNLSGSTFSFMAFLSNNVNPGLSVVNRNDTDAYLMLKELVKFYRTNGCIFQDGSTYTPKNEISSATSSQAQPTASFLKKYPDFAMKHPREGLIRERLYIRLTLDYASFLGFFESFDIVEESDHPFRMTYNLMFKSEKTVFLQG